MSANPLIVRGLKTEDTTPEFEYYATPLALINYAVARYAPGRCKAILDIGAGDDGRWGIGAAAHCQPSILAGVDIRELSRPDGYTHWYPNLDYTKPIERLLAMDTTNRFDFIVSNPPFSLAEQIIWAAWEQLNPGGVLLMLLPTRFQHGAGRALGLWRDLPPWEVGILAQRVNYEGHGDSNPRDDALFIWRKGRDGRPVGTPGELPGRVLSWR